MTDPQTETSEEGDENLRSRAWQESIGSDDAAKESLNDWDSPETMAKLRVQAAALRDQARTGGLRFEAYLSPDLADWILAHVERGTFHDPSEAVFVILGEHKDLEPHHDLRKELLKRILQQASDDPRPGIPAEEVIKQLREWAKNPSPPALWRKLP